METGDMMRTSFHNGLRLLGIGCGLLALGWLAAGCHTPASQASEAEVSAAAPTTAGAPADARAAEPAAPRRLTSDLLSVGDSVTVTLMDLPEAVSPMEVTIKEDGTITLPLLNQQVPAAGKTTGELEQAIKQCYVPGFYRRLTVQVRPLGQYYSVTGEVKSPNRYGYGSATTVLKAIASAGGFTEYARKTRVKVVRSDRRIEIENCLKALQTPKLDLPVYPGDLINVERRKSPFQR